MPKVSVLMPVYNNKDDILNAINSVINQTYTDWEIIIIDDCTTDGTYDVVNNFILENSMYNITLIKNNKNTGPYICLNKGLDIAKGDYICRLDSDDIFINIYLEKAVNILDNNMNIDIVHTKYSRNNCNEIRFGEITLFYRKKIIETIGYYDSVRFAGDSEFYERMYIKYKLNIRQLDLVTYIYNFRQGSLTNSSTSTYDARKQYVNYYRKWHKETNNLYIPFPLIKRLFVAHPMQINM